MSPSPKSPHRLMVEGPDDKHTIIHLLKRHGYDWEDTSQPRPYVEAVGGVEVLLDRATLSTALKTYKRLGLVVDADLPPTNRWHQARDVLGSLGYTLPQAPVAGGTIIDNPQTGQKVGLWLMPDNTQPGRIEEFIEKLIPPGHTTWPHAQATTQQARQLGARLSERDHLKGALHAWLAWQEDPGQPFGTALASRVLGHESPEARLFVEWFQRCFH